MKIVLHQVPELAMEGVVPRERLDGTSAASSYPWAGRWARKYGEHLPPHLHSSGRPPCAQGRTSTLTTITTDRILVEAYGSQAQPEIAADNAAMREEALRPALDGLHRNAEHRARPRVLPSAPPNCAHEAPGISGFLTKNFWSFPLPV
jgi:hypothetical protein